MPGGSMTQRGVRPTSHHGSQQLSVSLKRSMAHGVDPTMQSPQLSTCNSPVDRALGNTQLPQLLAANHPVLSFRPVANRPVDTPAPCLTVRGETRATFSP